jgi:hypothetical protein
MSGDFGSANPYASPAFAPLQSPDPRQRVQSKVLAPAVALIVVGVAGLAVSIFNFAFSFTEPMIDPNAPKIIQDMQAGATGPLVSVIQGIFCLLNSFLILGGVQMARFRTWGLALAASVAAMVNFGTCCCVVGLPVGIWSIVVLMSEDVKLAFAIASRQA